MGVTIRDVAKLADVSVATVSRALRGHSSVSTLTKEKVEAAATELAYALPYRSEHNIRTRALRVAVIMPNIGRWYYGQVLSGVESVVADREGDVMVFRPYDKQGRRRNLLDLIDNSIVDAVVVVSISLEESELAGLRERGIGVSLLGTTRPDVSNARIDDSDATRQLTEHLIELGHTRIGMISSAPINPIPKDVARDRRKGFEQAMTRGGLELDPALEVETDYSIRGAQRVVERLLSLDHPPTAIVAETDELAFGVMAAARSQGIRIPEDLSVTGVDDHEISELMGLTTIAQPVTSLAEVATWQAIARNESATSVVMPTSLIVRSSTMSLHE